MYVIVLREWSRGNETPGKMTILYFVDVKRVEDPKPDDLDCSKANGARSGGDWSHQINRIR